MIRLCKTPLWDKNVTHASYPYLPECFRNTILPWIPICLFWFILPLWLSAVSKQHIKLHRLPISTLFLSKMIFSVLFLFTQLVRLVHVLIILSEPTRDDAAKWITPSVNIMTTLMIVWLINADRIKGIHSSGLLFMFWLFVSLAILPDVIDYTVRFNERVCSTFIFDTANMETFLVWLQLAFALASWITHWFAEKSSLSKMTLNNRPMVPEMFVSFPSRIFYNWVTPLIAHGYRTPLTEKDCWELPISERTVTVVRQVRKTLQRSREKNFLSSPTLSAIDENHTLLKDENSSFRRHQKPIFWHALFRTYADKLIVGGMIKLAHDLCQFSGPLILKLILNFFTDRTAPKWLGIFYAILLSVTVFCQIVLLRAHFHCQFLVGIRFRSAITGLVYRKSLKLSNASKQQTTTGEIVNLMAIDATRFAEITHHMHTLWAGPVQLVIALVLLYRQMQFSIIPGVFLLFIMIPANLFLQRIQKQLTAQQMTIKDQRIKAMNEILNGIRVLKLYAWEMAFIRSITHVRQKELNYILRKAIISAISNILWTFTPILVGIMTFATYVLSSDTNVLTAEKAFVSLALFNLLRGPLVAFPNVISSVVEARVSNKRIQTFLNADEIDDHAVERVPMHASNSCAIKIEHGFFRWSNQTEDPLILKNIDLQISHGSLVALVGMVGSGKTSVLSALLGEMNKVQGHVLVSGDVAYVPQTAWILNASLKENILFGRDFDQTLYDQVLEACALRHDLNMLPAKDLTEIGEKGINLSGGQRQRVSLARALYSNADIYLLDDPLSAVDAHVGAHIFKHVIGPRGLLGNKTRLLVTHGVSHLNRCDDILIVSQGEIIDHGSYSELMVRSKILQDFVRSISNSDTHPLQRQLSDSEGPLSVPTTPTELIHNPLEMTANDVQQEVIQPMTIALEEKKRQLIEKETVHTGSVKWNIFSIYLRSGKLTMLVFIFLFFCFTVCASLATNIWLSQWTDNANITSRIYYMNIYSALGISQGLLTFVMQLIHKLAAFTAGRKLHWIILMGVLHAPMAFFDTTPIGRVINRFAKDIDSVDTTLPNAFSQSLTTLVTVVATLIILIYGSWFAILEFIPLAFLFAYIQRLYVTTSRQLRRLDSVTRSSIYANFSETIQGLSSIRAYHVQDRFTEISDQFMDRNQSCHLASSVSNRWLGVRLEMIANLLTLFTAITAVFMRDHLTAGTVGLMITFALQITHSLNLLVRMSSEIETNIVSVERIHEYAVLTPEAPWEIVEKKPSQQWPTHGHIRILDLSTRYRDNLQLVVKNLNLTIGPGEKIGIIGRTGCGKSSLCLALFRIIEPTDGTILIDDVDIRLIGLHDLRSRITIIPQDSVIFAGTIRFNLDPFGHYSDAEIWTVLGLVHLKDRIHALDHALSHPLAEGGQNMSAGERQLLCLARALLRRSKIIILDEATAAIDMETDRLIQRTLRTVFKDATVLTIAHRLHTILDSTKILVLSNGRLQEYDEPARLATNPRSAFAKLLRDANIRLTDRVVT